jgi:hypothetical protein
MQNGELTILESHLYILVNTDPKNRSCKLTYIFAGRSTGRLG